MKLILFRHGLAMERDDSFALKLDDSMRPLVEKGKDRTRKMAKALKPILGDVSVLATSPLLRAVQTSEILTGVMRFEQSFEVTELVPEAPPQAFARWLQTSVPRATSVVAVGHEPQLSVFASWCLAGANESFIDLKKSGAICLEVESFDSLAPGLAELKWVLSPKVFG
ncbi:MAG: histidine phosphatase family protein [Bdellovibrionaceae bacterium]|nr:histidine phosphatase family protein [Pseudobdellovibrionaceae bacterium]